MGWLQDQRISKGRSGRQTSRREERNIAHALFCFTCSALVFCSDLFCGLFYSFWVCSLIKKKKIGKLFSLEYTVKINCLHCIEFTFIFLNSSVVLFESILSGQLLCSSQKQLWMFSTAYSSSFLGISIFFKTYTILLNQA